MPKIALDAGHGLKTPGKQTPDGIKEWSLNDKVRDKVVKMLEPYEVVIINTDNNEGTTDESLSSRVARYRNEKVDAFVSVHHNAYTGNWNSASGVEVYTDRNATAADNRLAEAIYTRLVKYTGLNGRGVKKMNYTVINQNSIPAVLCEGGFMDGTKDYAYITSDEGQTAYAKAVAEGLIEFLNLRKKTSAVVKDVDQTAVKDTGSFKVKVEIRNLNIRKGPGTNYSKTGEYTGIGVFTIIETKTGKGSNTGWGKLKSGLGWISLDYAKRV